MARSTKFSVAREIFKVAKAANGLRKAVAAHSELVADVANRSNGYRDKARSSPNAPVKSDSRIETAYERKILDQHGDSVEKHFYNKLVGVNFANHDGSSRELAIQCLQEGQELELRREPHNKYDSNAILVGARGGKGLGYLSKRLAGEVSRSIDRGVHWRCYVRAILHTSGTQNWGVTIFMLKHTVNYTPRDFTGTPRDYTWLRWGVVGFLILGAVLVTIIYRC